jgi:hypothetical protein
MTAFFDLARKTQPNWLRNAGLLVPSWGSAIQRIDMVWFFGLRGRMEASDGIRHGGSAGSLMSSNEAIDTAGSQAGSEAS